MGRLYALLKAAARKPGQFGADKIMVFHARRFCISPKHLSSGMCRANLRTMDAAQRLIVRLAKHETWNGLGQRLGFAASYLHEVSRGKRSPSDRLLAALKLERRIVYRRVRDDVQ